MTLRTIFASTTAAFAFALAACGGSTTDGGSAGLGGGAGQGGGAGSAGSAGSAGGPSCQSDADCPAPAVCQICADGVTSSCAMGKCVAGACQVVYPPCPAIDGGACPPDVPIGKACAGNLTCTYGTETCCGHTYPSTVCDCMNGSFGCYATDACMIPPDACEDAGPPPQVPCGGFAGTPCPGQGQCVYPPNTCPDCGGYCECGVLVDCSDGWVFDGSPAVCACVAVNAVDGGAGK